MKQALESIVPPVEVIRSEEGANGLDVSWLFTVQKAFTIREGGSEMTWEPGDEFEMDARVVQVDDKWLIAGI